MRGKVLADMYIRGSSELATPCGSLIDGLSCGSAMEVITVIPNGAVAASRGRIVAVGPQDVLDDTVELTRGGVVVDARGGSVVPGLVDPHTHAVFAGWRTEDFCARLAGRSYLEILAQGGGILSTVAATRAASTEELALTLRDRLLRMLLNGVTTVEVKTGYGLSWEHEAKLLSVIKAVAGTVPVGVIPTFMAAHAIPPEYSKDPDRYVDQIVNVMIPEVARLGLARLVDVFCDEGGFSLAQARRILLRAGQLGFGLRVHADEFAAYGAAELAAELGATAADHLLCSKPSAWDKLASAGVVGVLLPGTALFLGKPYARARDMLRAGLALALGTDFNPGTCPVDSLTLIMGLACCGMGMKPAEVLTAVTLNAAWAVGEGGELGALEVGRRADIAVFEVPSHEHIPYRMGCARVSWVVKNGEVVVRNGELVQDARYGEQ